MAGRRPKPLALKLLTGRIRPAREDEPVAIPGTPEKPKLSKDASEEWDRLVAALEGEQRLATADRSHLLCAVKAYASAMAFERRANQRGTPPDDWRRFKTGERIQWDTYRKAINDLCLSQGTRARAKTGGRGKEVGKLGDFLARTPRG